MTLPKLSPKVVWKWLLMATDKLRGVLCLDVLLGVVRVALSLLFVWQSKQLIDLVSLTPGQPAAELWRRGAFLVATLLTDLVLAMGRTRLNAVLTAGMKNGLRATLFERLLCGRIDGSQPPHSGDTVNRLEEDVRVVSEAVGVSLPQSLVTLAQLVASSLFLAGMDSTLLVVLLVLMPLCLLLSKVFVKRLHHLTLSMRSSDGRIQSLMQESLHYRLLLRAFEKVAQTKTRFDAIQQTLYDQTQQRSRYLVFSKSMISFAFTAGYLFVLLWGMMKLNQQAISFGVMTAFLQLAARIQHPIVALAQQLPSFIYALASVERLEELRQLDVEEVIPPKPLGEEVGIRITDLSFCYPGESDQLFRHFSHCFRPGSKTVILGQTGVGKTTLLKLLLGILSPTEGRIDYYNAGEAYPAGPALRCNLVYVPQGNSLLSGTIRSNLLLGKSDATEDELREALFVAAAEFVWELPKALDTPCGEGGYGLSEGQAQRIALARALLRPGGLLLLDEVTSSLDEPTEKKVLDRLWAARSGQTILFISHRPMVTNYCDEVLTLL